jgi:predicted DNA-binding transcriptional regulator AlpA
MQQSSKILTRQEAAAKLRISERTLDRLISTDSGLKKVQLSVRRVGVTERSVEDYLASCVEAA